MVGLWYSSTIAKPNLWKISQSVHDSETHFCKHLRVLYFSNAPPQHVLKWLFYKFAHVRWSSHFWIDWFSKNMIIARHAYITSKLAWNYYPSRSHSRKIARNRYILLRHVLCETRLHHQINWLEIITRPGYVFSTTDFCYRQFEGQFWVELLWDINF